MSQEFESLINENNTLLTKDQTDKVAEVRKQLQLEAFEVLFAVHRLVYLHIYLRVELGLLIEYNDCRLDLEVLPLTKLGLVATIAPTEVDIKRISLFELSNNMRNLSDEEQFVVQLSKVERLREKLAVMRLMGTFDQNVRRIGQVTLLFF